jgi:glycerol transport system ATP-binding protein
MLELSNVQLSLEAAGTFAHTFAPGEITVVLGANKSGKTDLCRLIAGLHTCARGTLQLDGEDLGALGPRRRPVSLVYQAFINYPNLTVAENIDSPMRARRMPAATRHDRVNELAAVLQISDLLQRFPHQLSGGQQQRVAIARALAKDARVLLLDEPLVNLDFKLREALESELRGLLRSTGTVVIWTSSNPRDAFALGDQVLMLADGQKIQAGTPIAVYRQPASLAAMALLAEPGINRFSRDGAACALRPEHISVDPAGEQVDRLTFDMTVTAYETNGDESFIHGRVENREWVVRCHGMQNVRIGSTLPLNARNGDVLSF